MNAQGAVFETALIYVLPFVVLVGLLIVSLVKVWHGWEPGQPRPNRWTLAIRLIWVRVLVALADHFLWVSNQLAKASDGLQAHVDGVINAGVER